MKLQISVDVYTFFFSKKNVLFNGKIINKNFLSGYSLRHHQFFNRNDKFRQDNYHNDI